MADIVAEYLAYVAGYKQGKAETEAYLLHCGDDTPTTNADRIRAMTDEELAEWLDNMVLNCGGNNVPCSAFCPTNIEGSADCRTAWLDWLKQEVDDG